MRGWWALVGVLIATMLAGCSGKAGKALDADASPPVSTAEMLTRMGVALDGGDVVEATRLADLARHAELTVEQVAELRSLQARFGESDPTADAEITPDAADGGEPFAFGRASARVLRPVPAERLAAAGYEALPFFHEYREAAARCQYAWFDFGELSLARADVPASPLHRRAPADDRVVVFDFGELLFRVGIDAEKRAYYGATRVRGSRLSHHYEDVAGRAVTGVTERLDGAVRTLLLRHAD